MRLFQILRNLHAQARSEGSSLAWTLFDYACATAARLCLLPISRSTREDPYHLLFRKFVAEVNRIQGAKLLEIGSRARSGLVYTQGFDRHVRYTGLDIMEGPNVDVVGDIHNLSENVAAESADAIFCISVFEHLGMPWKAALEINNVLKPGGLLFIATHSTFPLHDRPWDFFRYSGDGFRTLFHKLSGFEILEIAEGLPCRVIPLGFEPAMKGMERRNTGYLGVAMLARKIGPADGRLAWDIRLEEFLTTHYPQGNLQDSVR